MGTDGERSSLVSGYGSYTDESGKDEISPPIEQIPEPANILGQFHQDALTQIGLGRFHWYIGLLAGLCFMADGVQVFILPYLIPSIQAEMCVEDANIHWLNTTTMIGLIVGALMSMRGDLAGRKFVLVYGLSMHFLLNTIAAFSPEFSLILMARFGSSVGLGMCYPTALIYLAEFFTQNHRGKLSILLIFWALGGFYVVFLAYSLLPASGEEVIYQLKDHKNNWQKVLLFSQLPTVLAIMLLCFAPESVRFLLHAGRDVNAIIMYQEMYKWNVSRSAQYQLAEMELPRRVVSSKPPPSNSSQFCRKVTGQIKHLKHLGLRQNLIPLVLLSLTWAALGFSYYGMSIWIPQHLQNLKDADYLAEVKVLRDKQEFQKTYTSGLYNQLFENVTFEACVLSSTLSHVTFQNCIINNSDLTGIHSSKTYFIDSIIENTRIYDTDLTEDRFINTQLINISYYFTKTSCRNDLDFRVNQTDKLRENMLRLITPFIALTVHYLCLYDFAKNKIGVVSMLFCSLMSIACWFLNEEITILVFDFVWSIIFLFAFNSVNIITVEAFPISVRATGFGICIALFRLFGLISSAIVNLVIPFTIVLLLIGGIALFRLHDTSFNLL